MIRLLYKSEDYKYAIMAYFALEDAGYRVRLDVNQNRVSEITINGK